MNFWDYFLYHTICDVQKEHSEQKEKKQQLNAKRMQAATNGLSDFGQAVLDIAGRAYQSDSVPRELLDGSMSAVLFAAATICRADGGMTAEQERVVQLVIKQFPGKMSVAGLKSAVNSSAPLAQFFPEGYLTQNGCGPFWRALYRCCKKSPAPSAELQTALDYYGDFLANFSFAGRTDTRAEMACNALLSYANQHLNDPENDAAPDFDTFGDGKPEDHMAKFQKIYLQVVSKSNAYAQIGDIDQLLPLFKAKTISDLVMLGDIPASSKITEVEFYFARYGVKLDLDAKSFLLSISSRDEFGIMVSNMMDMNGTQPSQFWAVCSTMCVMAKEDQQLIELTKTYCGFVYSLMAELRRKYPSGNYTQEKAKKITIQLLDALSSAMK